MVWFRVCVMAITRTQNTIFCSTSNIYMICDVCTAPNKTISSPPVKKKMSQNYAWIPPDRVYEQEIVRWIGTPQRVEERFVKLLGTRWIPENYLNDFELMLERVTDMILGDEIEAHFHTWVILLDIVILRDEGRTVILKNVITRPCAERKGFTRIVLFHLMRICYAADYDLTVDQPSLDMIRLLETVFDRRTVHDLDLGESNRPIRVELSHRRHLSNPWVALSISLRRRLRFEQPLSDYAPPPVPHLLPEGFPTAQELNFGPR